MAKQTELGKAFEYACVLAVIDKYGNNQQITIKESEPMETARKFFNNSINDIDREKMIKASKAAMRIIDRLEPCLSNFDNNDSLTLALQPDNKGGKGDVRDVLCIRSQSGWSIGFSCKHNHDAVKHSRLSMTIDFGQAWLNIPCSQTYFSAIKPIFNELEELKRRNVNWRDLQDKEIRFYVPILKAFLQELTRIYTGNSNDVPAAFIKYLIGREDFYKIIADDANKSTRIEGMNLNGSLNQSYKKIKPSSKVPEMPLPKTIYHMGFKNGSNNTIEIIMDNGWSVSLRLHSARSLVEPSLKFDIKLISSPHTSANFLEIWE